jgi:hypothetical protein
MSRTGLSVLLGGMFVAAAPLPAQTRDDGGIWLMWLGQGRLAARDSRFADLRWSLDVHARWRDEGAALDTTFVRPALGYALGDGTSAWLGYAAFDIDPGGRSSFLEQRVWQQLVWNAQAEDFTLMSRSRLEQRFFEGRGETGWRLRQLVKSTIPLTDDRRVFLSIYDEGFVDLADTDWGQRAGFRQNRAFAGVGWFLDAGRTTSVEVGYLNQWIDRPGEDGMNHVLSINMFVNF